MANAVHHRPTDDARQRDGGRDEAVSDDELLELFGDEYARRILQSIANDPSDGQSIAESMDVSPPTVYRRLDQLEAAGLVEAEMVFDADGHHYQQYRSVVAGASLQFGPDGLSVDVCTDDTRAAARTDSDTRDPVCTDGGRRTVAETDDA